MSLRVGDLISTSIHDIARSIAKPSLGVVIRCSKVRREVIIACGNQEHDVAPSADSGLVIDAESVGEGTIPGDIVIDLDRLFTVGADACTKVGRLTTEKTDRLLRKLAAIRTTEYYEFAHKPAAFARGKSAVPVSGRTYDAEDMRYLVDSALDFWLTTGRFAEEFEREFAGFLGAGSASLCNSGSSANLLALSCLTSPELGEKRLKPGDEVITLAAGFPTTVNPILQNSLVPVFVDIGIPTYNVEAGRLDEALSAKTRAVMIAHTLGNPFDVDAVLAFCERNDLWLIEDCCDALGSTYARRDASTAGQPASSAPLAGTFGHISTFSFYPAHHITMGEGGAVVTGDRRLKILLESFRDWGRACWCSPGHDDTCKRRFEWKLGDLPYGYDHKYTYSHVGYNLKPTDMQAAVGLAQLRKLPAFIEARKRNFKTLYDGLLPLQEFFILPEPTAKSDPSWFGFPIAVRPDAPFSRDALIRHLDRHKIGTRLLFGGNLTRQPAYKDLNYRIAGNLGNSDFVMNQVFWIGLHPGLNRPELEYVIDCFTDCAKQAGVHK